VLTRRSRVWHVTRNDMKKKASESKTVRETKRRNGTFEVRVFISALRLKRGNSEDKRLLAAFCFPLTAYFFEGRVLWV
jgi:hypothetical protein